MKSKFEKVNGAFDLCEKIHNAYLECKLDITLSIESNKDIEVLFNKNVILSNDRIYKTRVKKMNYDIESDRFNEVVLGFEVIAIWNERENRFT